MKVRSLLPVLAFLLVTFSVVSAEGQMTRRSRSTPAVQMDGASPRHLSFSFPTAMVSPEAIDTEENGPIVFKPAVNGKFRWKSQTEGVFSTNGPLPPGTTFQATLREGLRDLDGKPVSSGKKGNIVGVTESEPFTISTYTFKTELPLRPTVALSFSHPVKPEAVVKATYFQERETRKRFPVEVIIGQEAKETVEEITVTPREDLPRGGKFDLMVDRLVEAGTGTAMKELFVHPLGETEALRINRIAAFNYPLHKRRIAVEFSEPVDPAEGKKIVIEPRVAGVETVAKGEVLWLEGDFDITQRYTVTVPTSVVGKRGYGLTSESRWGATFRPKKPAIIFPTEDLHQRSNLGLRFAFIQANTGPLEWRLARVSPEKLLAVNERVREFTEKEIDPITGEEVVNPATGLPKWKSSELLIDASRLEVVAQGKIAASEPEMDQPVEIAWKPEGKIPAGPYVLEVFGKNPERKVIANRALVTFTEYALVVKRDPDELYLRVINIGDGKSLAGATIRVVTAKNERLAEFKTGPDGVARVKSDFLGQQSGMARWYLVETPEGTFLRPVGSGAFYSSGSYSYTSLRDTVRQVISTDRPLYRPGHTMKFKGFIRSLDPKGSELQIAPLKKVRWAITDENEDVVVERTAKVDEFGGFEGEWKIPEGGRVGSYSLNTELEGASTRFEVQEFRPPPFHVAIEDRKLSGARAGARFSSAYFHGGANAGARVKWKVTWTNISNPARDNTVVVTDIPREAPVVEYEKVVEGEGTLGGDGTLDVESAFPFVNGEARGWYDVTWDVKVTGLDGQTIAESLKTKVNAVPYLLSLSLDQGTQQKTSEVGEEERFLQKRIDFSASALDRDGKELAGVPVVVDFYQILSKTAKEKIAPNVFRYRNSVIFEKVKTAQGRTPFKGSEEVPMAGGYLAVVKSQEEEKEIPPFPGRVYISGEEGSFPQYDEKSLGVTSDKTKYIPGERALLSVQAPFSGVAWVCVEAESVIDGFFIALNGNTSRVELPIKKEYAPNAVATVYLLRPGGEERLPAERFGSVKIEVRRPDLELQVIPEFARKQVQPREEVSGHILVTSEGQPVAGADLTVYAVDEAVLDAGGWHEPPLRSTMYPQRVWSVTSYGGFERLTAGVPIDSLHQKGFIVGDSIVAKGGGYVEVGELRTNFPPLAFWKTQLRSDANGKVPFSFTAPDGLTKYRVIALAQTKKHQFGTGSDWVEVAKPLQVEPALPRFVRVGDEVELRAIVRQKVADELPITLHCETGLELEGSDSQTQKVRRGFPAIFRFKAKAGEVGSAKVRFVVPKLSEHDGNGDAVEIAVPVHPPTLLRKEALFGSLQSVKEEMPAEWSKATGTVDLMLSTSPWLPKITGLPLLLEYPHGCLEQVTSRVLAYSILGNLLEYLPSSAEREAAYKARIAMGVETLANSLTSDGFLPYWPGGGPSGLPSVSGYWAATKAKANGIAVPDRLIDPLRHSIEAIALGRRGAPNEPFSRAYALMVLSEEGDAKRYAPVVKELYSRRESWGEEPRALLAIAMHQFKIMPKEMEQLCREINRPVEERGFDPDDFRSTTRAEAIRALAFATINPPGIEGKAPEEIQRKVEESLESARSLSTQENFWLLLAFNAMHAPLQGPPVAFTDSKPVPAAISRNGASAAWSGLDIRRIGEFALAVDRKESLVCLMEAEYRTDSPETQRTDRGFRVERVVKNLTAPERRGTKEAPFKLGDEVLLTYRLHSPKLQHYVAVEDELPGALEIVNPKIASIARTYSLPPREEGEKELALSFSELRDRTATLYFDRVAPGSGSYSILARVTCAGLFRWPATQATPMYDSRFSGLSPSGVCYVEGE